MNATPRLIPDIEMRGFMEALLDLGKFEYSGLAWFLTSVQVANRDAVRASEGRAGNEHRNPQHLLIGPILVRPAIDLLTWARDIRNGTFDASGEGWLKSAARERFESIITDIPLNWFPAAHPSRRYAA